MKYQPTIGLEIHIELKTKTKMFCRCLNDPFCRDPNIHVCPVCLGLPGALPYPNQQAVLSTVILGRALSCEVAAFSQWDRKNYFYPDLPKGFQVSQYDWPIARHGSLKLKIGNQELKTIRIRRVHLEEDTGKLLHPKDGYSLIDYNRSGVPLVELVTEPDLSDAKEARLFGKELQKIVRHLGISQANMEKGELRVEANVSLQTQNSKLKTQKLGTKVEIKNLNSFRAVERAIDYEIKRQQLVLQQGGQVEQQTRGWDDRRSVTFSQRVKETEGDYRYFPEPDLPPMKLNELEAIKELKVIETIDQQRRRMIEDYEISPADVEIILKDKARLKIIEQIVNRPIGDDLIKRVVKLVINRPEIVDRSIDDIVSISQLTSHQQKMVLDKDQSPEEVKLMIVGKEQPGQLSQLARKVIGDNQKAVQDYRAGKDQALGFLIGQLMRESAGNMDPNLIREEILKLL